MRILLTGGAGFIGSHLFEELSKAHTVDVFDKAIDPNNDLLTEKGITNFKRWLEQDRYEIVVHLAAQVGRAFGEDDIDHTIKSNAMMTARVVRSLTNERFVYVSTSEIYGDMYDLTACEDANSDEIQSAKFLPHNLYGLTKRHGEEISALYMPKGGLQVIRPSMPFGPGLPYGRGRAAIINMLWQSDTDQEIPVHQGSERSWCYISDTVKGFRMVIENGEVAHTPDEYLSGWGCYNVGNDTQPTTMYTVAHMACEITGKPYDKIKLIPAPSNQTIVKRLSMNKLQALGWQPEVTLREGMERTYEEIKDEWQ